MFREAVGNMYDREGRFRFDGCYRIARWNMQAALRSKDAHDTLRMLQPGSSTSRIQYVSVLDMQEHENTLGLPTSDPAATDIRRDTTNWNDVVVPRQ